MSDASGSDARSKTKESAPGSSPCGVCVIAEPHRNRIGCPRYALANLGHPIPSEFAMTQTPEGRLKVTLVQISFRAATVLPSSAMTLPAEGKKPQVPPLRCAPVGMTILLRYPLLVPLTGAKGNSHSKIVIPTGAQRSGGTCGFFPSAGSVVADKGADRNMLRDDLATRCRSL